jgi:hypothetical protein
MLTEVAGEAGWLFFGSLIKQLVGQISLEEFEVGLFSGLEYGRTLWSKKAEELWE